MESISSLLLNCPDEIKNLDYADSVVIWHAWDADSICAALILARLFPSVAFSSSPTPPDDAPVVSVNMPLPERGLFGISRLRHPGCMSSTTWNYPLTDACVSVMAWRIAVEKGDVPAADLPRLGSIFAPMCLSSYRLQSLDIVSGKLLRTLFTLTDAENDIRQVAALFPPVLAGLSLPDALRGDVRVASIPAPRKERQGLWRTTDARFAAAQARQIAQRTGTFTLVLDDHGRGAAYGPHLDAFVEQHTVDPDLIVFPDAVPPLPAGPAIPRQRPVKTVFFSELSCDPRAVCEEDVVYETVARAVNVADDGQCPTCLFRDEEGNVLNAVLPRLAPPRNGEQYLVRYNVFWRRDAPFIVPESCSPLEE